MKRSVYIWKLITIFLLLFLSACATTTGPKVTDKEIETATEELRIKAAKRFIETKQWVHTVSWRLLKAIPKEDFKKRRGGIGIDLYNLKDPVLARIAGKEASSSDRLIISFVTPKTPASVAGLKTGDIIKEIAGKKVTDMADYSRAVEDIRPGKATKFTILRNNQILDIDVIPADMPRLDVFVIDSPEINAFADPSGVYVTYGMLRFIKSDDELAFVLGHEMAHLTKGHLLKSTGSQILSGIIGILVGGVMSRYDPQGGQVLGDTVARGLHAPFSRELEREADYFGLLYTHRAGFDIVKASEFWERFAIELPATMTRSYLGTHPSSPERMVRMKKSVEEILKGDRDTTAPNP